MRAPMGRRTRGGCLVVLSIVLAVAFAPEVGPVARAGGGEEAIPVDFRCAGDPPRQTADPLSPPCIPIWEGDNECETADHGVTCDEIRILVYLDGNIRYIAGSDLSNQVAPGGRLYDLWQPPEESEHLTVRGLRVWQEYFDQRFQTYDRRPHFFVLFSLGESPEQRRFDAVMAAEVVDPFAAVSLADGDNIDQFIRALAERGVVNFGAEGLVPASFFRAFPGHVWGYQPSAEVAVGNYSSYLCQKVVGRPPVLAAADVQARAAGVRTLGILHTTDPAWPGLVAAAAKVKEGVEACGGAIAAEATFDDCCLAQDGVGLDDLVALRQMAEFKAGGVSTILWTGGIDGDYGRAAQLLGYGPEWFVLGDGYLDANQPVRRSTNSAAFHGRAITVTPQVLTGGLHDWLCYRFFREIDTTTPDSDVSYVCGYYPHLHQAFTAFQVAGHLLDAGSLDAGMHAIPQRYSSDPAVPACFYDVGDYTCVKDAQAEIWDADGPAPGDDRPGCWRSIELGRRYHAGTWPDGNVDAQITGNDPCNGYSRSVRFRLN